MPVTPPGKVQFNVYLPADLVVRIKHAAIDDRSSLSGFTERVFEEHLGPMEKEQS